MEALVMGVIVLFFAVVLSDWIARALPLAVPLPLIQIAMGGALSYGTGFTIQIEPHLFFLVFLPPLLFLDGWRIPKDDLVKDLPIISGMAMGLVLLSVLGIGWLIHQIFPAVPLAVSFAWLPFCLRPTPLPLAPLRRKLRFPNASCTSWRVSPF